MSGRINTATSKIAALCSLIKCSFLKQRLLKKKQCLPCLHCKCVAISGYGTLHYCDSISKSYLP